MLITVREFSQVSVRDFHDCHSSTRSFTVTDLFSLTRTW